MLKSKSVLEVKIDDQFVCEVYCNNDTPLGLLHDGLMKAKGWVVERMIKAQEEEEAHAKAVKQKDEEKNGSESEL